jgi:hypothetical protein
MAKKIKFITLLISLSLTWFTLTSQVLAAGCDIQGSVWLSNLGIPNGLLIPCECLSSNVELQNNCMSLDVFLQTLVNFSNLILALTGSGALLMFTYGGLMFILAAGKQEWVQKGKAALGAAAIGLAIILGAWLVVNFTILALTQGKIGSTAQIFANTQWAQPFVAVPKGQ